MITILKKIKEAGRKLALEFISEDTIKMEKDLTVLKCRGISLRTFDLLSEAFEDFEEKPEPEIGLKIEKTLEMFCIFLICLLDGLNIPDLPERLILLQKHKEKAALEPIPTYEMVIMIIKATLSFLLAENSKPKPEPEEKIEVGDEVSHIRHFDQGTIEEIEPRARIGQIWYDLKDLKLIRKRPKT